jgi:antitoxin CptB
VGVLGRHRVAADPLSREAIELRRLRWRCRRGMRELDQLFERYLDKRWATAEPSERAAFERLLACEDDALWRWFLHHTVAQDPELDAAVRHVLAAAD